jgi:DNA-binding NtrC family response regulator
LPTILYMENGRSLNSVRQILEQDGCDVVPSDSSQHALGVLARLPIDGVVLSYYEGDTESLSLRNQIRHIEPYLPVLLLSEHGSAMRASLHTLAAYIREHPLSERLVCSQ